MEASIVGAGLILAMYALIVPMTHRIFEENIKDLNAKIKKFEELKSKITPESKDREITALSDLRSEIGSMQQFPSYLGRGAVLTFFLYILTIFVDLLLFLTPPSTILGFLVFTFFTLATFAFLVVGGGAIITIYNIVKRDFDEITKKQKELELNPIKEI